MIRSCLHALLFSSLLSAAASAGAQSHPATPRPFNLPPNAELGYAVKAKQSGLMLDGETTMRWQATDGKYTITTETRAMVAGRILQASSEGAIDAFGLAPVRFHEKRLRRDGMSANFDRQARTIRFSGADATYPIEGGEQDRSSVVWQLAANARAAPKKMTAGSEWQYFVVGQTDAEAWTFKVLKTEKINTGIGAIHAWRIARTQGNAKGQQLEIWLAPSHDYYPVRIRHTESDGNYIEQTIDSIRK